jgi:hypothetical protein
MKHDIIVDEKRKKGSTFNVIKITKTIQGRYDLLSKKMTKIHNWKHVSAVREGAHNCVNIKNEDKKI